ncbi:hypothetical protein ES319_A13G257900v1 [Gossypium barbadense]|uniref:Transcription repressor n=2 Tax=Gossypium TaxID=3633 RepID=A0A2P5YCD2_GOSBA|nr:hypothetical protein ES319_A13G257900v1 [Gossypium barbadense]PPS13227.1 hypothetical protein GOBAR_AA07429 [Gossypium barbadense]TYG88161.1 hypothetical protein ES288_A13G273200v1 [Gossypium darwinii]
MGNYRFRFSDMIPNAWFYKLKDMNKTRTHHSKQKKLPTSQTHHNSKPRHFTSEPFKAARLHVEASGDPPRKSLKRRDRRRTVYKPSPRAISSASAGLCRHTIPILNNSAHHYSLSPFESYPESSDSEDDEFLAPPPSTSYNCQLSSSTTDIIIDMHNTSKFDAISELELPPILTKLPKSNHKADECTKLMRSSSPRSSPLVRKSLGTPGIKLRANSPKIASKKIQAAYARKSMSPCRYLKFRNRSIAESLAVVKSSLDPQRDFRDSMVEMIVENNIRSSKELEDLLACYLSLNSNQYHDLIIKAFEQIWFDMTNLRL